MAFRISSAILLAGLAVIFPQVLPAQGIFEGFGFPKTVIATGHTEVIGSVHVALRLGAASADTLVIDLSPLPITNTSAPDIRVTTSGNVTVGAVTIEAAEGRVRVPVNAGGTNGSLRVDGIRVSIAGTNRSSVTARLSWAGLNILSAGQSVVVVDQVRSGLVVDPMTQADGFIVYNNVVIDSTAAIKLREAYAGAFVNSTEFGQNTPARIRIRVTDYPAGLIMSFPATVAAGESAASLSTVEGSAVDIPRADGTTEVTYNFNSAANSSDVVESFNIPFTVSTSGTVAILQPTIELSLAPIGAAVPATALPATNVPRFAEENLVSLEGTSRIITKNLYWTGIDNSRENRLAIFNPSTGAVNVTFSAFDAAGQLIAGTNIANSVRQSLSANQSSSQTLTEIFGTGAANIATVRVQSTSREVVALGTTSGGGLSESISLLDRGIPNFVVPSTGEDARLNLFNPGNAKVSGTLTFRTATGAAVSTRSVDIDSLASVSLSYQDLFGTNGPGQIGGSFGGPVVAFESFGTASTLNYVAAQVPAGLPSLYVPFFATGGGYETDLNLINSSDQLVTLTAQLVDNQGSAIASSTRQITMPAGGQLSTTVGQLFQVQNLISSGYVRLQVPPVSRGFWTFYPAISGHARIRGGQSASTVIPLSGYPQSDSSILESGVSSGFFQGIALVNPNNGTVAVTLQALSSTGAVLLTATVNLAAGQISSRLVTEYFSAAIPEHSVIRVTSALPIVVTSVTGSSSGNLLRAAPGLR